MMTFVVRLTRDKVGRITGVVEQVKTGLKARVEGLDSLGRSIGEMIASRWTDLQHPPETGRAPCHHNCGLPLTPQGPAPRRVDISRSRQTETRLLAKSPSGFEPVFSGRS